MNWGKAKKLISKNIFEGLDVNTGKSTYRKVLEVSEKGFIVPKGKKCNIDVPWNILEKCLFLKKINFFLCLNMIC